MISRTAEDVDASGASARGWDRLGLLLALVGAAGVLFLPFATYRANRIVPGEARGLFEALPPNFASGVALVLLLLAALSILRGRPALRLASALAGQIGRAHV